MTSSQDASLQRYCSKIMCMVRFADELRHLATDPVIQFGCVIFPIDCSSVLSIGYNGYPSGMEHEASRDIELDTPGGSGICHAELNALTKLNTQSAPPSILFVHRTPCMRCAGQIVNARCIVGVIHEDPYIDDGAGLRWTQKGCVPTVHRTVIEHLAAGKTTHPIETQTVHNWQRRSTAVRW
jgi:deoxycytidylate deaminase